VELCPLSSDFQSNPVGGSSEPEQDPAKSFMELLDETPSQPSNEQHPRSASIPPSELANPTRQASKTEVIEWKKNVQAADTDGFEIKRVGSANLNLKIFLTLEGTPKKYKLSSELASLLRIHTDTKPHIIMALWQYIKVS
jgi:chromatin remodeling complex protein RSC6